MWGEAVTEVWGVGGAAPSAAEVASAEGAVGSPAEGGALVENQTPHPPLESRAPRRGSGGTGSGYGGPGAPCRG